VIINELALQNAPKNMVGTHILNHALDSASTCANILTMRNVTIPLDALDFSPALKYTTIVFYIAVSILNSFTWSMSSILYVLWSLLFHQLLRVVYCNLGIEGNPNEIQHDPKGYLAYILTVSSIVFQSIFFVF